MPEPYWPKRKNSYTLAQAEQNARHARVWCSYCKRERYFLLAELRTAFGNIEIDDVVYQAGWQCSQCHNQLEIKIGDPPASGGVIIRRLRSVDYVRRVRWRDQKM